MTSAGTNACSSMKVRHQRESGTGRTRTGDPGLMNPLLYQLSYSAEEVPDFMPARAFRK